MDRLGFGFAVIGKCVFKEPGSKIMLTLQEGKV